MTQPQQQESEEEMADAHMESLPNAEVPYAPFRFIREAFLAGLAASEKERRRLSRNISDIIAGKWKLDVQYALEAQLTAANAERDEWKRISEDVRGQVFSAGVRIGEMQALVEDQGKAVMEYSGLAELRRQRIVALEAERDRYKLALEEIRALPVHRRQRASCMARDALEPVKEKQGGGE